MDKHRPSVFPWPENRKEFSFRHLLLAEVRSGTDVPRKSQNVIYVAEEASV
jgi:hypothetical protein